MGRGGLSWTGVVPGREEEGSQSWGVAKNMLTVMTMRSTPDDKGGAVWKEREGGPMGRAVATKARKCWDCAMVFCRLGVLVCKFQTVRASLIQNVWNERCFGFWILECLHVIRRDIGNAPKSKQTIHLLHAHPRVHSLKVARHSIFSQFVFWL